MFMWGYVLWILIATIIFTLLCVFIGDYTISNVESRYGPYALKHDSYAVDWQNTYQIKHHAPTWYKNLVKFFFPSSDRLF